MIKSLVIAFSFTTSFCLSQDNNLLNKISKIQIRNDTFYNDGLFPSQRFFGKSRNSREDNNIFFTSLIVYTLQSIRDSFPSSRSKLLDSVILKSTSNYFRYRNRNGDFTYNFWQTCPDQPFPNSKFLSQREKMKLPDDLDDTSIIFLTKTTNEAVDIALRQKMMMHASNNRIKSIYKRYRNYQAYPTWFGDKMPQDLDICVMSNVLLFIFQKGFELNNTDQETLDLIKEIVITNDHIVHPHIVSPHYKNSSIILYHLSRLISVADNPVLNSIREKIIIDLKKQLQLSKNEMEKVILLTSLYRLGEKIDFKISINSAEKDFNTFYWFRANPSSGKNMFLKRLLGKNSLFQFKYKCDAYYWTLLLEFQTLSTKLNTQNGS